MSGGKKSGPKGPPQMGNLLNLERVPALAPKFSNKIGKVCGGFSVMYESSGTCVKVRSWLDGKGKFFPMDSGVQKEEVIDLNEFERRNALKNEPSPEERVFALRRKYELRLNKEFPVKGPASGTEADIQAWLGSLPFNERIALLKSQKDFEKSKSGSNPT